MAVASYATFLADVPDDQVEKDGDVVIPGGSGVAEILRAGAAHRGLRTSAVYQDSSYGWAFDILLDRVRVWCMVQYSDQWLLITAVQHRLLQGLLGHRPDEKHERVLAVLREVLEVPPIGHAAWMTPAEYERGQALPNAR